MARRAGHRPPGQGGPVLRHRTAPMHRRGPDFHGSAGGSPAPDPALARTGAGHRLAGEEWQPGLSRADDPARAHPRSVRGGADGRSADGDEVRTLATFDDEPKSGKENARMADDQGSLKPVIFANPFVDLLRIEGSYPDAGTARTVIEQRPELSNIHGAMRSEEHTSELQSPLNLVC